MTLFAEFMTPNGRRSSVRAHTTGSPCQADDDDADPVECRAVRAAESGPVLAALPEVTLPELRLLVVGGEALAPARFRHWIDRHQVANAYGPTEATIATHVAPHLMADNQPAPLGRSVPGVEDFLLDEDNQPVPDGQPGHLHLAGVGLDDGYPGLPDRTVDAFPRLGIGGRAVRVYRTGDRARRRPDGQLVYAGRIDRQLNLGGVRLEPEEVEAAALTLDGVTAAAVLAEPAGGRDVLALHVAVPCGGSPRRHCPRTWLACFPRLPSPPVSTCTPRSR
ncbi:AMP-binding protein [Streptomyces virginiae]|uniref:AMP-binding protein n=1 Tax=Streptomyces virginiae TaxID=1961 RepID=UPI0036F84644